MSPEQPSALAMPALGGPAGSALGRRQRRSAVPLGCDPKSSVSISGAAASQGGCTSCPVLLVSSSLLMGHMGVSRRSPGREVEDEV